jgi:hypothetical protein
MQERLLIVRDEVMGGDGTKHDAAQRCDEGGYCSQGSRFIFFITVVIITGRRVGGGIVGVEDPSPLIGQWANGVGRYVIGGKGREA